MSLQKVQIDYIDFGSAAANQVILFNGSSVVWANTPPTANLEGYTTNTDLIANLAPYVTNADLIANLSGYVTSSNIVAIVGNNAATDIITYWTAFGV